MTSTVGRDDRRSSSADPAANPTVKSARRVLEILEYFAQSVREATVVEVANALAYPQSSTSVLLASLATLGYLRFDAGRRTYSPTLRVMLLGSRLQDELFGGGSLVSVMERLRQRTGQTVMIGLRQGIHVRFIFSLKGSDPNALRYPVGVLRPVCRSAVGKILLSALPDSQVLRIARHANAQEQAPENRVSTKELQNEIVSVRQNGWAMTVDYPLPNRATLAVPLPDMPGQPPMALCIGSRKPTMLARHSQFLAELGRACGALAMARPPHPEVAAQT